MSDQPIGRFHYIVIDTVDPARIAPFWCALLGVEERGWFGEDYLTLKDNDRTVPAIAFQRVPESKSFKNRIHLDLEVEEMDDAIRRIRELGGSVISEERELDGYRWRVLADPEGDEFCIAPPELSAFSYARCRRTWRIRTLPVWSTAREYTFVATGISAAVAATEITIESSASHVLASPSTIRVGITSGAENGSSEATVASVVSGSVVALIPMKNEPRITIVSGVMVDWRSSCRVTIEPATANMLA